MTARMSAMVGVALIAICASAPTMARDEDAIPTMDERVEDVEEIEIVEEITAVNEIGPMRRPSGIPGLLGQMHPAVVHLPIGGFMLVVLIELGAFFLNRPCWKDWGFLTHILTLFSFAPAVVTGLLKASYLPEDPDLHALMTTHRNLMFVTILFF